MVFNAGGEKGQQKPVKTKGDVTNTNAPMSLCPDVSNTGHCRLRIRFTGQVLVHLILVSYH